MYPNLEDKRLSIFSNKNKRRRRRRRRRWRGRTTPSTPRVRAQDLRGHWSPHSHDVVYRRALPVHRRTTLRIDDDDDDDEGGGGRGRGNFSAPRPDHNDQRTPSWPRHTTTCDSGFDSWRPCGMLPPRTGEPSFGGVRRGGGIGTRDSGESVGGAGGRRDFVSRRQERRGN